MPKISGPAVHSCPWCGRSVEQGESCWCRQSQEAAMIPQEIRVALKEARADNDRLEAENVRLASMLGEEARRRKEAEAERARLWEALDTLQRSEAAYRMAHDVHGDGALAAGRAWDILRRAGDKARGVLFPLGGVAANQARAALKPAGGEPHV